MNQNRIKDAMRDNKDKKKGQNRIRNGDRKNPCKDNKKRMNQNRYKDVSWYIDLEFKFPFD